MSPPHLTALPIEVLEKIGLHLPGQDIVKMKAVRGAELYPTPCGSFDFALYDLD